MDLLNKSFASFAEEEPSFANLSFGNISLISGGGENNNFVSSDEESDLCLWQNTSDLES